MSLSPSELVVASVSGSGVADRLQDSMGAEPFRTPLGSRVLVSNQRPVWVDRAWVWASAPGEREEALGPLLDQLERGRISPEEIPPALSSSRGGFLLWARPGDDALHGWTPWLSLRRVWWARGEHIEVLGGSAAAAIRLVGRAKLADDAWLRWILFQSISDQESWFDDVRCVPTGQIFRWRARGEPEWDQPLTLPAASESSLEQVRASVLTAVSEQVGAPESSFVYFSGGTDSSVMSLLASRRLGRPIPGLTAALDHATFEAARRQAQIASRRLDAPHKVVSSDSVALAEAIQTLSARTLQPLVDWYPLYLALSNHARASHHATGIDGGGANALLGRALTRSARLTERVAAASRAGQEPSISLVFEVAGREGLQISGPGEVERERWPELILQAAAHLDDEEHPLHALNQGDVLHPLLARTCFGEEAVARQLARRRQHATARFRGRDLAERLHIQYLASAAHFYGSQCVAIADAVGLSCRKPCFDTRVVQAALGLHPEVRLIERSSTRPVMNHLLREAGFGDLCFTHAAPWYSDGVERVLGAWARSGPLRPLLEEMDRPPFVEPEDFEKWRRFPNRFVLRA